MSEEAKNEQVEQEVPGSQEARAADHRQPGDERLTVVGIGASAGGLAALQGFFDNMPADTGMAFVVVTHMDPERESLLPEILQKHTAMPVRQVEVLSAIEGNHAYVIPPGRRILVTDTHLETQEFEEPRGRRTPVDDFFRSLAAVHRQAVAVILSGGGTDGSVGVKAVKEEGGLLMVQEPAEAEHDGMPRAAIATGLADMVLPVAELARKLLAYHTNGVHVPRAPEALSEDELDNLYRILTQVQAHTGHDFSQYKRATLLRRIQRRIQLNGRQTMDAYLSHLRHDPAEARALFKDLLIGVTNFFRDAEAWEALAAKIVPHLFNGKERGDTVRVWSIGCSTGEEAYSLAILLLEQRDEQATRLERPPAMLPGLQLFASDLDDAALEKAREGVYPEAIEADVSPERLERWFKKEGYTYRVRQELRDIVLFSGHSVLRDPPFSRLDLISCRNLLIYLNREVQENVFRIFHYALRPESYLFLGSAESAGMVDDLFHTLDKQHRLYRAHPARSEHPPVPNLPLSLPAGQRHQLPAGGAGRPAALRQRRSTGEELHEALLEAAAPPSVLVDAEYRVLHISETAGRYLRHPRGAPTGDLLKLIHPALKFELRSALFQVFEHEQPALSRSVYVEFNGGAPITRRVILAAHPRPGNGGERLALVFFLEDASSMEAAPAADAAEAPEDPAGAGEEAGRHAPLLARLEVENRRLRERLQTTTEESESSHEELKAANEELQSINEEYRSTTEELETSKEELQSVNEELQSVNAELKNKLAEVSRAHGDLENLLGVADIATLFLDRELRIRRYIGSTTKLFHVMPGDRGRPLSHLTNRLQYDALTEDARQVLETLVPVEREVQDREGRWFLAQLRPYRTPNDRIDGVVLSFVDVDRLKAAEAALWEKKEYSEQIIHTIREGLLVLHPDLTVEFANDSFYQMFDVSPAETVDERIYDLGNGQWDIPELRTLLEEILPAQKVFDGYRVERTFEGVGHRVILLNARRLDHVDKILLAIEDVTEKEEYEEERRARQRELAALNETLEQRVEQVEKLARALTLAEHEEQGRIAQDLHDDLQQQLYALQIQLSFLRAETTPAAEAKIEEMEEILETATQTARQLSVDLSPQILEGKGLAEAIGWLGSLMQERHRLQVTVEAEGSFAVPALDRRVLLFQAVRELLFNVVKHARVPEATVRLQHVDDAEFGPSYRIDVIDEGGGFDLGRVLRPEAPQKGRGLLHIRQRLKLVGGRLEAASIPDDGSRVTIVVPPHTGAGKVQEEA